MSQIFFSTFLNLARLMNTLLNFSELKQVTTLDITTPNTVKGGHKKQPDAMRNGCPIGYEPEDLVAASTKKKKGKK